jgi:DegV family protein with EDD domain
MIRIVADSACDIPAEWRARWGISLIYAYVNLDSVSYPDDGVALPHEEFYRRMAAARALPTTAAPSPGQAQAVIRAALEGAEQVVVFTVASALSSIYNSVRIAAATIDPARVTVVDTGSLSLGAGFQAIAGAEAAAQGGGVADVLAVAEAARRRTEVWAAADSLDHLRRSGRVNALMAGIGTLLQIKPIITIRDNAVTNIARARTINKALQAIADLAQACAPLEKLAFLHTHAPQAAEVLRGIMGDISKSLTETPVIDVNTALGVHFGQGAVGLALMRE